jgi:hypothetical protein
MLRKTNVLDTKQLCFLILDSQHLEQVTNTRHNITTISHIDNKHKVYHITHEHVKESEYGSMTHKTYGKSNRCVFITHYAPYQSNFPSPPLWRQAPKMSKN